MPDLEVLPQLLDLQLGRPSGERAPKEPAPPGEDAAVDGHLAAIGEGNLGVGEEVEVAAAAVLGGEDGLEVVGEADEGGPVGRGRRAGGGEGGGVGGRSAVDAAAVADDLVGVR